ncbi:MAG TPA: nucleotidyltransferase family protein [Burkholderiaceae bacterium]
MFIIIGAADYPARPFSMRHDARMDRSQTLALLGAHKPVLAQRFGVTGLALFGSVARGTAGEGSDVDLLVEFDGPATSSRYFGVQFYLEDLLGSPVDLVTGKALRPRLRPYVERDAVSI